MYRDDPLEGVGEAGMRQGKGYKGVGGRWERELRDRERKAAEKVLTSELWTDMKSIGNESVWPEKNGTKPMLSKDSPIKSKLSWIHTNIFFFRPWRYVREKSQLHLSTSQMSFMIDNKLRQLRTDDVIQDKYEYNLKCNLL